MKKPEDIKKGLKCCNTYNNCRECPYDNDYEGWFCTVERNADALAYIQELEANRHRWRSPKVEPPDVDTFYAVTKFDSNIKVYKKNLVDHHYTTEWLNIRNDILYWMPIPDVPKEDA